MHLEYPHHHDDSTGRLKNAPLIAHKIRTNNCMPNMRTTCNTKCIPASPSCISSITRQHLQQTPQHHQHTRHDQHHLQQALVARKLHESETHSDQKQPCKSDVLAKESEVTCGPLEGPSGKGDTMKGRCWSIVSRQWHPLARAASAGSSEGCKGFVQGKAMASATGLAQTTLMPNVFVLGSARWCCPALPVKECGSYVGQTVDGAFLWLAWCLKALPQGARFAETTRRSPRGINCHFGRPNIGPCLAGSSLG